MNDTNIPHNLPKEPGITINGILLSESQAMTVRVAIEVFAGKLNEYQFAKDLGSDLALNYLNRIYEIREIIFQEDVYKGFKDAKV